MRVEQVYGIFAEQYIEGESLPYSDTELMCMGEPLDMTFIKEDQDGKHYVFHPVDPGIKLYIEDGDWVIYNEQGFAFPVTQEELDSNYQEYGNDV